MRARKTVASGRRDPARTVSTSACWKEWGHEWLAKGEDKRLRSANFVRDLNDAKLRLVWRDRGVGETKQCGATDGILPTYRIAF